MTPPPFDNDRAAQSLSVLRLRREDGPVNCFRPINNKPDFGDRLSFGSSLAPNDDSLNLNAPPPEASLSDDRVFDISVFHRKSSLRSAEQLCPVPCLDCRESLTGFAILILAVPIFSLSTPTH